MADTKIPYDKHKKGINDKVIAYLRRSETSGNTPTEQQFREFGFLLVNNIAIGYEDELERDEYKGLVETLNNYFETEMVPKYMRSLREHPREVNGYEPRQISEEAISSYKQALKEEKLSLVKDIEYLVKESEKSNRTPTKVQTISWLKERMEADLARWNDEQGKRYVISSINAWIEDEYAKRMSKSLRKKPRKENGHWPWKTDQEEQQGEQSGGLGENGDLLPEDAEGVPSTGTRKKFASDYVKTYQTFSGYDMVCMVELHMPKGGTYTQVVGQLQTITYSIHQEKSPIRCLGDMNAKGYVFGPRTIAGTMIFTVFDRHWTSKMMKAYLDEAGINAHMLADEFPPLNFTISCANEYGHNAVCSLFGVTLVNEGQVMSINDVFTENTYQFYATDVQYLAPVETTSGGMKKSTEDLPKVNTGAEPSPEKPTPQEKLEQPPKNEAEPTNPDPEKPKKEDELPREGKQSDTSPAEDEKQTEQPQPDPGKQKPDPEEQMPDPGSSNPNPVLDEFSDREKVVVTTEKYEKLLADLLKKYEEAMNAIKNVPDSKLPPIVKQRRCQQLKVEFDRRKRALDEMLAKAHRRY